MDNKCLCGKIFENSCECLENGIKTGELLEVICSNCTNIFPIIVENGENCPNCGQPSNLHPVRRIRTRYYCNYYNIEIKEIDLIIENVKLKSLIYKQNELNKLFKNTIERFLETPVRYRLYWEDDFQNIDKYINEIDNTK